MVSGDATDGKLANDIRVGALTNGLLTPFCDPYLDSEDDLRWKVTKTNLTAEQGVQLMEILLKFRKVFSKRPGLTHKYEHTI